MNTVQSAAVIALSLTAAVRIILFDTRGKKHKPLSAAIAYLSIVWFCSLALAAAFSIKSLTIWLLIFGLALHTGAVLWSGGNISKIHPKKTRPSTENQGFLNRVSKKIPQENI
ncbi:phage holin family protein [Neisseria sp. RH3002v2g]|jgi:hypothetical protein|uniref:phage holin family protein n=1 Tax=Neisseria sp. RH3002v2g TaxID=1871109 RepID=UPI001660D622|nr:phage holin family protein [Neisseria sp. RH3002v2g]